MPVHFAEYSLPLLSRRVVLLEVPMLVLRRLRGEGSWSRRIELEHVLPSVDEVRRSRLLTGIGP